MSWRKVSPSGTVRYMARDYRSAPGYEEEISERIGQLVWVAPRVVSRMIEEKQHLRIAVFRNNGYRGMIGYLYHRGEQLTTASEGGFKGDEEGDYP